MAKADENDGDAAQDAARDRMVGIESTKKEITRLERLVSKREEMLEAAQAQLEKAEYKVTRRTEILEGHAAELEEARAKLAALEAEQAEAAVPATA